jgi:hypothetical protein
MIGGAIPLPVPFVGGVLPFIILKEGFIYLNRNIS